jgi:hypothetical protein
VKQKGKLRGNRATEKIFIDNDLTKQEREIQKKLRAICQRRKKKRERCKSGVHENNHREEGRWTKKKGKWKESTTGNKRNKVRKGGKEQKYYTGTWPD